jgi:hypothetical protein
VAVGRTVWGHKLTMTGGGRVVWARFGDDCVSICKSKLVDQAGEVVMATVR